MKRMLMQDLTVWKNSVQRKPLILRGARQVGKTYLIREFGQTFSNFVEINLEETIDARIIFEGNLVSEEMIKKLSIISNQIIVPGKTLLFLDEAQVTPRAIIALRYFYEKMPDLHVIAAGSLLDFAIEKVGVPVGRVSFMHLYPMSFLEFLIANGYDSLAKAILEYDIEKSLLDEPIHSLLNQRLCEYLAVGGLPEAVQCWVKTKDIMQCAPVYDDLIVAYRQDFQKYAKRQQIKYVDLLFNEISSQLGRRFKFSNVSQDYKKRELSPCIDLLEKANIITKVSHTSANGLPLGAEVDHEKFKLIMLDVALSQKLLDLTVGEWILNPEHAFVNKGEFIEAFVGQEILAYLGPHSDHKLYYWHRELRGSNAEVDYIVQKNNDIIPIEVKSGKTGTLKSLWLFLDSHIKSPYGIRFSKQKVSVDKKLFSYPLYAIPAVFAQKERLLKWIGKNGAAPSQ